MHRALVVAVRLLPVAAALTVFADLSRADDLDGAMSSVIRASDTDGDGIEDVLVLGRGPHRGQLLALRMSTFEVLWCQLDSNPSYGQNIQSVGDFDGDGITDYSVGSDAPYGHTNVAIVSGSSGDLLVRKFGFHRIVLVPTPSPSWLLIRRRVSTSYLVSTNPQTWQVVADKSPFSLVRINPHSDELLDCYSDADALAQDLEGWDGTAVTTGSGVQLALAGGHMLRICTLGGTVVRELSTHDQCDPFPWSVTVPAPASQGTHAHVLVSTHHRRCEVFEAEAWRAVRTISGRNVTGVADAFTSSVDAYYEPKASEPTVVIGAAEMWAEPFDEGYLTLSRPGETKPLVLLDNREIGYHACFIGDLDGDGTREIFSVEVSPMKENGRARKETVDAFVLDGRDGHVLSKGLVRFQQPQRKPRSR